MAHLERSLALEGQSCFPITVGATAQTLAQLIGQDIPETSLEKPANGARISIETNEVRFCTGKGTAPTSSIGIKTDNTNFIELEPDASDLIENIQLIRAGAADATGQVEFYHGDASGV